MQRRAVVTDACLRRESAERRACRYVDVHHALVRYPATARRARDSVVFHAARGRPVENCFIESFNSKLRDERFNERHIRHAD